MPLLAAGSALVAGSISERDHMQAQQAAAKPAPTMQVKVLRSFFYRRGSSGSLEPVKVGEVLEVPAIFGRELVAGNKAAPADIKPAADAVKGGK